MNHFELKIKRDKPISKELMKEIDEEYWKSTITYPFPFPFLGNLYSKEKMNELETKFKWLKIHYNEWEYVGTYTIAHDNNNKPEMITTYCDYFINHEEGLFIQVGSERYKTQPKNDPINVKYLGIAKLKEDFI